MIRRDPNLLASRAVKGATAIEVSASGMVARPGLEGGVPSTNCTYSASRNQKPIITTKVMVTTAEPMLKRRSANNSSGSMGWRARICQATSTAPKTIATAKADSTAADVQPCSGPSMMP